MATYSQTNIHVDSIDKFLMELKKYYKIGRIETLDQAKDYYYFEYGSDTIVVSQNYNSEWIEVEFNFNGNLYFYDEFLRRVSETYRTNIVLGYEQTTSGEIRIAEFENGRLSLSIVHKYFEYDRKSKIYLADNFGVNEQLKELFSIPRLGEEIKPDYAIEREQMVDFFKMRGWSNNLNKDFSQWTYCHIEKIRD